MDLIGGLLSTLGFLDSNESETPPTHDLSPSTRLEKPYRHPSNIPTSLGPTESFALGVASFHESLLVHNDIFAARSIYESLCGHVKAGRGGEGGESASSPTARRGGGVGGGGRGGVHLERDDDSSGTSMLHLRRSPPKSTKGPKGDPRLEMLDDLRVRLREGGERLLVELRVKCAQRVEGPDAARQVWCTTADLDGDGPTLLFAAIASQHFAAFTQDACRALEGWGGEGGKIEREGGGATPYLLAHLGVLQSSLPPGASRAMEQGKLDIRAAWTLKQAMDSAGSPHSGGGEEEQGGSTSGGKALMRALPSTTPPLTEPSSLPSAFITAIATVLGEASAWEEGMMSQPVPNGARFTVASALHETAGAAAVVLLDGFGAVSYSGGTRALARAVTDYMEGRVPRGDANFFATRGAWEDACGACVSAWVRGKLEEVNGEESSGSGGSGSGSGGGGVGGGATLAPSAVAIGGGGGRVFNITGAKSPPSSTFHAYPSKASEAAYRVAERVGLEGGGGPGVSHQDSGGGSSGATPFVRPPSHPALPSFPVSLTGALAILDECCDQYAFLCSTCERYERLVSRCLGLGSASQPSSRRDTFSVASQGLQGEYVTLERAWALAALGKACEDPPPLLPRALPPSHLLTALETPPQGEASSSSSTTPNSTSSSSVSPPPLLPPPSQGWKTTSVHEDPRILTFTFVDSAFFIASKALSRSCSSCSPLPAAAVINFVAEALAESEGGGLGKALKVCIEVCGQVRWDAPWGIEGAGGGGGGGGEGGGSVTAPRHHSSPGGLLGKKKGVGVSRQEGDDEEDDLDLELKAHLMFTTARDVLMKANGGEGGSGGGGFASYSMGGGSGGGGIESFSLDKEGQGGGGGVGGGGGGGGDGMSMKVALSPPLLSPSAHTALNTLVTAAEFYHSLYQRTRDEVARVFPAPPPTASPQVEEGGEGGDYELSSLPPPLHPALVGPLDTLHLSCVVGADAVKSGVKRACSVVCGEGLSAMARCFIAGVGVLASYALTLETYELLTSGGGGGGGKGGRPPPFSPSSLKKGAVEEDVVVVQGDPLLTPFFTTVLGGLGGLRATLTGKQLHPNASTSLLYEVADRCAGLLEGGWWGSGVAVNEYGALLMQEQLREIKDALIGLAPQGGVPMGGGWGGVMGGGGDGSNFTSTPTLGGGPPHSPSSSHAASHSSKPGAVAIRERFAPLSQAVSLLLRVDRVADLYALTFPKPLLSRAQVEGLMAQKVGASATKGVDWGRVGCVKD